MGGLLVLSGCTSAQNEEQMDVQLTQQSATATLMPSVSVSPTTQILVVVEQATLFPPSYTPEATTSNPIPTTVLSNTVVSSDLAPPGWIVFALLGESIDIMRTDGTGWRQVVESIDFPTTPKWSPNGRWIAVIGSSDASKTGTQIYIVRPDGSEIRQLPVTSGYQNSLDWSPDGQKLIYSQTNGSPEQPDVDIFLYDFNRQEVIQITNTPDIFEFNPVFSPHGDVVAYIAARKDSQSPVFRLMLMDTDGGNPRQVLETPMNIDSLAWSPNGTRIVFSSGGTETSVYACNDLYTINADGSGLKSLTASPFRDSSPSWSPDGEWIIFNRAVCNYPSAPGFEQIYTIHSSGNDLKQLADIPGSTSPSWSPCPVLQIGETFAITELGTDLALRTLPSLSGETLRKLKRGEEILVLTGPREIDKFLWWQVKVIGSNIDGWVAETPCWFDER